jgi:uncharacterized protein YjbJ (UPF0337 family)
MLSTSPNSDVIANLLFERPHFLFDVISDYSSRLEFPHEVLVNQMGAFYSLGEYLASSITSLAIDSTLNIQGPKRQDEPMSDTREEGKIRKEYGKAEEKIGKDMDDPNMKIQGKADKEYGKAEEKVGKKIEEERNS